MPTNTTAGAIAILQAVTAAAAFSFSRGDSYAFLYAIPDADVGTTVTLPENPSGGDWYEVRDEDGSCGATSPITLLPNGSETVGGAASAVYTAAGVRVRATYSTRDNNWSLVVTSALVVPPAVAPLPLADTRWIDGLTTGSTPTGSEGEPFPSVSTWLASLPKPATSAADAITVRLGLLSPAPVAAYTQALTIPAWRSVTLSSFVDAQSNASQGNALVSAITWANTAAAAGPGAIKPAFVALTLDGTNFLAGSSLTITDDGAGSPIAFLTITGQQGAAASLGEGFTGNITATGAAELEQINFINAGYNGTLDAPHSIVVGSGSGSFFEGGTITGEIVAGFDCSFLSNIVANPFAEFLRCVFESPLTITAPSISFGQGCAFHAAVTLAATSCSSDGQSWASFVEAGGVQGATKVLVTGGFLSGVVTGAALAQQGGTLSVSLNGTGATAGYTVGGNSYSAPIGTVLTASQAVQVIKGGGEKPGDTLNVSISNPAGSGAFVWTVLDNLGNELLAVPAASNGFVVLQYNGANWVYLQGSAYVP